MKKINVISYKSGIEGPKHDPYSYEEITVEGRNGKITVHLGLAYWIKSNNHKLDIPDAQINNVFTKLTGISIDTAMRTYRIRPYRIHARTCGSRSFSSESGYPGETLYVCDKCRQIVDSAMNWSAIE